MLRNDPINSPDLPCAEALVAGTVALMTSWIDPCPNCSLPLAEQRALLARKVVSNLFFLARHPALNTNLRQVMDRAHRRWLPLAQALDAAAPPASTADTCAVAGGHTNTALH